MGAGQALTIGKGRLIPAAERIDPTKIVSPVMVREGAPTTSSFALAHDVDADLRRHDGKRGRRVGFNSRWYDTSACPAR
jgi:hypothetical protein